MDRPLNIAHCVESYAPAIGGMPEVVRQLSERMVRMGHRATVLTAAHPERKGTIMNGVQVHGFELRGNAVEGIRGDPRPYLEALRNGGYDVVTFFAAQQWATDAALDHLSSIPARKVFVPTGFSLLHDPRYTAYYAAMPDHLRAMDLNVFLSDHYQDVAFARGHGIEKRVLIPNGAAREEFERPMGFDLRAHCGIGAGERIVLHVGSYTGIKGHKEALRIFLRAATPDTALVFIGNHIERFEREYRHHRFHLSDRWRVRLRGKRIHFLDLDRASTVDAMRQADLFLFPSRVECSPIVLFETLAAGVPFLASEAGNTAEIVDWTHGGWTIPGVKDTRGWVLPDITSGAAGLERLLERPAERREAAQAGHKAWEEHFTWQRIAEQYVQQYQRLVHG